MREKKNVFRDYQTSAKKVINTYKTMHENQNLTFVKTMKKNYASSDGYINPMGQKIHKHIIEIFAELDKLIDESDPDTHLPQIYHAYQTGEALKIFLDNNHLTQLRRDISIKDLFSADEWNLLPTYYQKHYAIHLHKFYAEIKDWSWLPLIGFLHDTGKVLATPEWGALPQWAVVGDTFPVGAPFSPSNIFYSNKFYAHNDDLNISEANNKQFGIYSRNCGFDKIDMSWGHDEYLYSVLKRMHHNLPDEALYIIRFHSFYAWHSPRNGIRGYTEVASERDWQLLPLLKVFQKSDLYSKHAAVPDTEKLKNYYFDLFEHFVLSNVSQNINSRLTHILW